MNSIEHTKDGFSPLRRRLLILPLALVGGRLFAAETPDVTTPVPTTPAPTAPAPGVVPPLPSGACPLNSGGPSLLGSRWKVMSVYGNKVPQELQMTMEVGQHAMTGRGGCNNYSASFVQVGNRGFKVTNIQRPDTPCEVLRPAPGAPTIDVGSWEGQYLKVLRRAGSVQQQGSLLQCYDFNGKASIVFVKRYGSRTPA